MDKRIPTHKEVTCHSHRILCIITGCGGGDWPPLLALAGGLSRSGHDLLVICDRSTLKAVDDAKLKALCIPPELDLKNIFEPAISSLLSKGKKLDLGDGNPLEKWGNSVIDFIVVALKDWHPSLVITTLLGVGLGGVMSKRLSTPWCFLNPAYYFGHFSERTWETDFSKMGVEMYRHWLLPYTQMANLVLHATDHDFDFSPAILPLNHIYVGPLFWEMTYPAKEFLYESARPLVLVAVSTSPQSGDLGLVKIALKALGSMSFNVLVTLAPEHDKDEIGEVPANVSLMDYVPHSMILPLCRFVICHAGHGIVMKSMVHGVPMVLVPWGRDQPGVAVRAKQQGVAVVVAKSECNALTLTDAINEIVGNPEYLRRSQDVSYRLGRMDGVARAVGAVESFLEK